ncbi:MAG: siderophore-interacting protein [Actinomycetota bacterium]|nr:siderophore-interacting protein [Actinomycetota bacterium]
MSDAPTDRRGGSEATSARDPSAVTAALAARQGVPALALSVTDVVERGAGMRQVTVADPRLAEAPWHPGQDLTISLPATGGRSVTRRYSIRRLDRDRATADLLASAHGSGPGARWVAAVRPGDRLEAIGPRGKIWATPDASWHLFVGDETYLAASFAMAESLPGGATATVVLEVGPDVGEEPCEAVAELRGPYRVVRNPVGAGEPGVELIDALERLDLPPGSGDGHAYLGGEAKLVAALRAWLIGHGWQAEAISAKAYWRSDKANQDHGEPERD